MNRRKWVAGLSGLFAAAALPLGATRGARAAEKFPLTKAREEWKGLLPAEAFPRGAYAPAQDEILLRRHRLPRVAAFARANGIDRVAMGDADAPLGIVPAGKCWHELRLALRALGLDNDPRIASTVNWLCEREVTLVGDWAANLRPHDRAAQQKVRALTQRLRQF